ncbi:MAG: outer membrane protein assembly factor BamA [Pseudomonadota bacterium]|nr:outer membrane protein assembly factor BamA [Pseudomonadota bacterium]
MTSGKNIFGGRTSAALLVGTILGGWSGPLFAQDPLAAEPVQTSAPVTIDTPAQTTVPATADAPAQTTAPATTIAPAPAPAAATPAAQTGTIRSLAIRGLQRLEPETVRAYANLNPGEGYTTEKLDQALKDLYATELFSDVVISGTDTGNIVITVQESPVINRIVLEGNKRLKNDKILPEIKLTPRQIFTRSKVRADVERIVELYKRQGRFAARVEPKTVQLDQNRVDLVFEIYEGDKSSVRSINIIGNEQFSDGRLQKEMFTREAGGLLGFLKSNDSYDPDRLAADQQKLRVFYLTQGYADFRVVSALAELTPDRRDFVITYVVEEGPRYRLGKVQAESELRDLTPENIAKIVNLRTGDWFNAKAVEDAVADVSSAAGNLGYAFADINPAYDRDPANRVMNITLRVGDTPRVYVERIDIQGNTITRDKVLRREFRVNEGDAFNAIKVKRSQDRLRSLGYFQESLEIKQTEGSAPDRVALAVDVEEQSTGQLQLSAGYSSLESFLLAASIAQRNFMGKGQELNAGVNWSRYSRSAQLGFVEPYLFDRQILLGGSIFRRDYNSFNFVDNERNRTYSQASTGGSLRLGFPVTEYLSFGTRYSLINDNITLSKDAFFTDPDGSGPLGRECDPVKAGRYLCDELGARVSSVAGYSLAFDNTNGIRPTRGQRMSISQDFAGLGGDVKYIRSRGDATKYWGFGSGFVLSAHAEGGYIHPLEDSKGDGRDPIRITDRFFGAQLRGFDIRGIGPRIQRLSYDEEGEVQSGGATVTDALGGRAYYMGRLELELPTNSTLRGFGLRPSAFIDAGSVFSLLSPTLTDIPGVCGITTGSGTTLVTRFENLAPGQSRADCASVLEVDPTSTISFAPGFRERFVGNSARPRLAIGVGVNWNSPFGPLRIDVARALLKQEGDDPKLFNFNVGTQF